MAILLFLGTPILAFVVWTTFSIFRNYQLAQRIGLPIVISPVSTLNPFWILLWRGFPAVLSLKHLPLGLGTWARCTSMGWAFQDKHKLHAEIGPLFTLVTPAANEVTVADPEAAHAVLARRKDYIKPAAMYEQLNVFGRNLNTVEGEEWQRHRRLTAPSFNEKTSSLVWEEARRQARDMASSWSRQGPQGTTEVVADTATLALHVLTCAGFGESYPFNQGVRKVAKGHAMTYRDSLALCLSNIITFAIIPKRYLSTSFFPQKLRKLGQAVQEFQQYMEEMLARERDSGANGTSETPNLMSALVRASDEDAHAKDSGQHSSKLGLTDEEIFGNIFAYNLAGHETTANTVAYALVLLAAHPQYQDWVREEIMQVQDTLAGDYNSNFPRLQRCLAVMYETLRLYGSIVFIPRAASLESQKLVNRKGDEFVLPPSTSVNLNVQALHTDPKTWGPDSLSWRPSRWFTGSNRRTPSEKETESQTFISVPKGSFIPWADGPRVCPGQKFAQVEFVAVIATLLGKYRVKPVLEAGQTEADGRKSLLEMVDDSAIFAITLQMNQPRKVALVWEALG
ncbi:MAG: hypothetical protein LQ339_002219 [Xanthoria mediterranea]|nr:MAG: hypothetical protein LQ339_002219 [Xanthoria mediterranea]